MLSWIFLVLVHWNNSPRIDMSPHSDTLSWFRANQSLLFLCVFIRGNQNLTCKDTDYFSKKFTRLLEDLKDSSLHKLINIAKHDHCVHKNPQHFSFYFSVLFYICNCYIVINVHALFNVFISYNCYIVINVHALFNVYICYNCYVIQRRRLHKLVKLVSDPFCLYQQIKLL